MNKNIPSLCIISLCLWSGYMSAAQLSINYTPYMHLSEKILEKTQGTFLRYCYHSDPAIEQLKPLKFMDTLYECPFLCSISESECKKNRATDREKIIKATPLALFWMGVINRRVQEASSTILSKRTTVQGVLNEKIELSIGERQVYLYLKKQGIQNHPADDPIKRQQLFECQLRNYVEFLGEIKKEK